jgi:hypothetical protein
MARRVALYERGCNRVAGSCFRPMSLLSLIWRWSQAFAHAPLSSEQVLWYRSGFMPLGRFLAVVQSGLELAGATE